MEFRDKNGAVFKYSFTQTPPEPVSDAKLKRFEDKLEQLRKLYKEDPSRRKLYVSQAKMIQAGIDIIKKKLSKTQRKIF